MYLNCHSQYSLRYGTISVDGLIEQAKAHGVEQLALTDINNSTGVMEFIRKAYKAAIKPIAGMEFRRDKQLLYIGIARNREGFKELNDFLTFHNLNEQILPDQPWEFQNAYIIYPFSGKTDIALKENEYIGIQYGQLNRLFAKPLARIKEKLVALHPVTVSNRLEYRLHQYLRAIDLNTLLTKVDERDQALTTEVFLSAGELEKKFESHPFIIRNTEQFLSNCSIKVDFGISRNRKTFTGSPKDDLALLQKLVMEGMQFRYGLKNKEALARVKKEIKVINELGFCAYFLITWDIIRYSMSRGYYHVGRGSGANSIAAYCLRITDVDPIELDLYFERFLNKHRTSPPDFDIDYSWDEREDVQDYIFKRYGSQYTALLGTMSTFKDRSIIREISKVMGLPPGEISGFTDRTQGNFNRTNPTFQKILTIHKLMENMPNQRSIHAGGVLISEEPITYSTALDLPPKGMPTVQWDMYEAEEIGYEKFDILSQAGIGHIRDGAKIISDNCGKQVKVHDFASFKKDAKINDQLRTGNTIGCFYIESPAMRQLIKKLKCDNYLLLVAASSIIRPGVSSSGMMPTFIKYHHAPDLVEYIHPVMEEQLKETHGVMIYQEDVLKVCIHFAGMSGDDADVLRRGMSGKFRSPKEFERVKQNFFDGAAKLERPDPIVNEVWRLVSSFAGYSFSKAHSASFAVESYQSLYLKTYFPREFMVAVLNNRGGFYKGERWVYVNELRKAGANVHLPCVNHSEERVIIKGIDAYLGLGDIMGLEGSIQEAIPVERRCNGPFLSFEDFVKRTAITLEQAIILIRVGALRFTGKSKKELLWDVYHHLGNKPAVKQTAELFSVPAKDYKFTLITQTDLENAYDEIEFLGYPVTLNISDLMRSIYRGNVMSSNLRDYVGQTVKLTGLYVCNKEVPTKNNTKMWFGTFLDLDGNWIDTVHFPNNTPANPFRGMGCYLIEGTVVEEFGFASIEVKQFARLPVKPDPRYEN